MIVCVCGSLNKMFIYNDISYMLVNLKIQDKYQVDFNLIDSYNVQMINVIFAISINRIVNFLEHLPYNILNSN